MGYQDKEKQKAYQAQHYKDNKKAFQDRRNDRAKLLRMISNAVKEEPCMDCGMRYPPYVMDFDHRDGTSKHDNPSNVRNFSSAKAFINELAKCDVVCANCHRIRTYNRS